MICDVCVWTAFFTWLILSYIFKKMKMINRKKKSLISVPTHFCNGGNDICPRINLPSWYLLFPITSSVGFYRVWVIGEIKYGAAQSVQTCVTEPVALQAQLEISVCFQLCSHTYSPIEKFVMLYLPETLLATGPLKARYTGQSFLWLFTWLSWDLEIFQHIPHLSESIPDLDWSSTDITFSSTKQNKEWGQILITALFN